MQQRIEEVTATRSPKHPRPEKNTAPVTEAQRAARCADLASAKEAARAARASEIAEARATLEKHACECPHAARDGAAQRIVDDLRRQLRAIPLQGTAVAWARRCAAQLGSRIVELAAAHGIPSAPDLLASCHAFEQLALATFDEECRESPAVESVTSSDLASVFSEFSEAAQAAILAQGVQS